MKRILFFIQNIFKKIWNAYVDAFALKDFRSAELSAKKGDIGAIEYIAILHEKGSRVVQKNIVTAYCLYHVLSEKNISSANEKMKLLKSQMTDAQLSEAKKYIYDWNEKNNASK